VGELELFAENGRELVQRDVHLEGVLARALPGLLAAFAFLLLAVTADGIARIAVPLPRASGLLVREAETRNVDVGDRDRNEIFAFATDELALRDVLAQVLANASPDDVAKSRVVLVDLEGHREEVYPTSEAPRRPFL